MKPYKPYTEEVLQEALSMIREKRMTFYRASKAYGIPNATLRKRAKGNTSSKQGRPTVFDAETENKIENWILEMAEVGMPVKKSFLIKSVLLLAHNCGVEDRLKTGNF
jgi:hypothetical protein